MKKINLVPIFIVLLTLLSFSVAAATTITFASPTYANASTTYAASIPVNITSTGTYHYLMTDFNRDLRLWMRFQDFNSTNGVLDLSSWKNNGTANNVNYLTGGRFGNMSQFLQSDSRIVVPDHVSLKGLTYLTISAWINTSATQTSRVIAGKHGGGNGGEYFLGTTATQLRFTAINQTATNPRANCDITYTYNTGQWIHLVGTYNGSTMLMYLNGTLVSSSCDNTITGRLNSVSSNFVVGDFAAFTQPWNGTVDDVMVWNRSLTAAEVGALYNATASQYYRNFTNLSFGNYNTTVYSQNASGYEDNSFRTFTLGYPMPNITAWSINRTNTVHWWMRHNQTVPLNVTCSDSLSTDYSYKWYVNGNLESSSANPNFTFDATTNYQSVVIGARNNLTVLCNNTYNNNATKQFNIEVLNSTDVVFITLPDTQYYSQNYPSVYYNQTQWISNMKTWFNLAFVTHTGDIVQNGDQSSEWNVANLSMYKLDRVSQNYEVTAGNHDYGNFPDISNRNLTLFNAYFPLSRFSSMSTYGGSFNETAENQYHRVSIDGRTYMFLTYEFCPRNSTLDWANSVISNYSTDYVVMTTHMFLYDDGRRTNATTDYTCSAYSVGSQGNHGEKQWNYTVNNHSNIFMMISGHQIGGGVANRTDLGVNNNTVHQILDNYQTENGYANGGDGWLRIYILRPNQSIISVETYSPFTDNINNSNSNWFTLSQNFSYLTVDDESSSSSNASSSSSGGGGGYSHDLGSFELKTVDEGSNVNPSSYSPGKLFTLRVNTYNSQKVGVDVAYVLVNFTNYPGFSSAYLERESHGVYSGSFLPQSDAPSTLDYTITISYGGVVLTKSYSMSLEKVEEAVVETVKEEVSTRTFLQRLNDNLLFVASLVFIIAALCLLVYRKLHAPLSHRSVKHSRRR